MRKIDLTDYPVKTDKGEEPFTVKSSLIAALSAPTFKLISCDFRMIDKIEKGSTEVLLEEFEYERLKMAFDSITGFNINAKTLVLRVLDAQRV
jgi:hypothetical protein